MFRIKPMDHYDGCRPITIYMVQKKSGRKWVNIKGFSNKQKAKDLKKLLS